MNMIGHDHNRAKINRPLIRAHARIYNDCAGPIGEHPSSVSTERQEMRLTIALKMREIAAVKRLRHDE